MRNGMRRKSLQSMDGVETGFALDVAEVFDVPAHEVLEPGHGADGIALGVGGVFGRDDALAQIGGDAFFHFICGPTDGGSAGAVRTLCSSPTAARLRPCKWCRDVSPNP